MKHYRIKDILVLFVIILFLPTTYSRTAEYTHQTMRNKQTIFKEKFSDVLLVIHFNHPHYDNITFLRELYSPAFEHIVFYGEKPNPEVYDTYTRGGYLLSGVVQDVLSRFPHHKGYLFLQDDCVLHFWNYVSLDLNKIWYAVKFNDGKVANSKFYDIKHSNGHNVGLGWGGWGMPWGSNAAFSACANLLPMDVDYLHKNIGANNISIQMCEVFYIPQRFNASASRLSEIFKNVFCEIAIPTMLCCLDLIENWEQLTMLGGEAVGYGGIHSPILAKYPTEVSWVHPMKFSQQVNRDGIAAIFKQVCSS